MDFNTLVNFLGVCSALNVGFGAAIYFFDKLTGYSGETNSFPCRE